MADAKPSGEERKTMGGNEMSAEELQSKYPTIERLADLSNTTVGYQVNVLVLEAVACFHELAQAKAELSALSPASGEAVAQPIFYADGEQISDWQKGNRRGGAIDLRVTSSLHQKTCNTPLYLAAPTAPGMCLVPVEQVERAIVWAEACAEFGMQAAFPDGSPTPNADLATSIAADFKAIAAAKGRAAT